MGSEDVRGIDADEFKATLGRFVTGVGVLTTTVDGIPRGMTVNAVSSVSLDPPLVLVCVERRTAMADHVVGAGVFALSFLAADQAAVSIAFADSSRAEGTAGFVDVGSQAHVTGSPVLEGNVGWVDCRVWSVADGGDHVIVVGEVVALGRGAERPLAYHRGSYATVAPVSSDATEAGEVDG